MRKISAKNKIALLVIVWVLVSASMFLYFFKLMGSFNQQTEAAVAQKQNQLAVLQGQKNAYLQSKDDLRKLTAEPVQPQDFFSRDVTLVDEIKALEDLSSRLGLKMVLSGISGEASSAQKAPIQSPVVIIPYGISISGSLSSVDEFLQSLNHLPFVTTTHSLDISPAGGGDVNVNLSADFYLNP